MVKRHDGKGGACVEEAKPKLEIKQLGEIDVDATIC